MSLCSLFPRRSPRARRPARLGLEALEARAVPAVTAPGLGLGDLLPGVVAPDGTPAASVVFWTNPGGGDWNTPTNWSTGAVPGANQYAVIALPGVTVTHVGNGADAVRGLFCVGTLRVEGGSLEVSASSAVRDLRLFGGRLTGPGDLQVETFTWTGGTLAGPGALTVTETLHVSGGAKGLDGRTLANAGLALWSGGAVRSLSGGVIENLSGATFVAAADDFLEVEFRNAGTFRTQVGAGGQATVLAFTNAGQVSLEGGALVAGHYAQTAGTTALQGGRLASGHAVRLLGGSLTGGGRIDADLVNGAALDLRGAGALLVQGDYAQLADGVVLVSASSAQAYDRLNVAGRAALAGALQMDFVGPYRPTADDAFVVLTYGDRVGSLEAVYGSAKGGAVPLGAQYREHSLTLAAAGSATSEGGLVAKPLPLVQALASVAQQASKPAASDPEVGRPSGPFGGNEGRGFGGGPALGAVRPADRLADFGDGPAPARGRRDPIAYLLLNTLADASARLNGVSVSADPPAAPGDRAASPTPAGSALVAAGSFKATAADIFGAWEEGALEFFALRLPDLDLTSSEELIATSEIAGAQLTGAEPRADLLPQRGAQVAPVATLVTGVEAGPRVGPAAGEESPLHRLLIDPVAGAPAEEGAGAEVGLPPAAEPVEAVVREVSSSVVGRVLRPLLAVAAVWLGLLITREAERTERGRGPGR